jgi:hypothetical protein
MAYHYLETATILNSRPVLKALFAMALAVIHVLSAPDAGRRRGGAVNLASGAGIGAAGKAGQKVKMNY